MISAMEQKQIQRAEIHLPTWHISVQGAFGRCGDERGFAGIVENDYVLSFTIPKGTSRRNAMNTSHHASNTFSRKVTLQAQTAHLASVKTISSKKVFLESCASLEFKQQERPDLGLEDVDRQGVDPKAAEHHALEIYRKNDRQGASKSCCQGKEKRR